MLLPISRCILFYFVLCYSIAFLFVFEIYLFHIIMVNTEGWKIERERICAAMCPIAGMVKCQGFKVATLSTPQTLKPRSHVIWLPLVVCRSISCLVSLNTGMAVIFSHCLHITISASNPLHYYLHFNLNILQKMLPRSLCWLWNYTRLNSVQLPAVTPGIDRIYIFSFWMLYESQLFISLCNPVKFFFDFIYYSKWTRSSEVVLLCVLWCRNVYIKKTTSLSDQTAPCKHNITDSNLCANVESECVQSYCPVH